MAFDRIDFVFVNENIEVPEEYALIDRLYTLASTVVLFISEQTNVVPPQGVVDVLDDAKAYLEKGECRGETQ